MVGPKIHEIRGYTAQVVRHVYVDDGIARAPAGIEGFGLGCADGAAVLTLRHLDGDLLSVVLDDQRLDVLVMLLTDFAASRTGSAVGKGRAIQ